MSLVRLPRNPERKKSKKNISGTENYSRPLSSREARSPPRNWDKHPSSERTPRFLGYHPLSKYTPYPERDACSPRVSIFSKGSFRKAKKYKVYRAAQLALDPGLLFGIAEENGQALCQFSFPPISSERLRQRLVPCWQREAAAPVRSSRPPLAAARTSKEPSISAIIAISIFI